MQEYLYAVAYVAPRSEKVVTVGLATALSRGDIFFWGSLMAGALVVGLPTALLYSLVLDRFPPGPVQDVNRPEVPRWRRSPPGCGSILPGRRCSP